jgi:alpha-2-macroglobulin
MRFNPTFCLLLLLVLPQNLSAQERPLVEEFYPQGLVRNVSQVQAVFSEPMVSFGDPREAVQPFEISCEFPGTGRWVDTRRWVYDFEAPLPSGVYCEFRLRGDIRSLTGQEITGERAFAFSTGGPAILSTHPYEGDESIDEEQIFILELDGPPDEASLRANVHFAVEGVGERIEVRVVTGNRRRQILDQANHPYRYRGEQPARDLLLLQARRKFPQAARVELIWGSGVSSKSGIRNREAQSLSFKTRPPFLAEFHCERENATAGCIPLTPMSVRFTAPIAVEKAREIVLRGAEGRQWDPDLQEDEEFTELPRQVSRVSFRGPFPPKTEFQIQLPGNLRDETGRTLANADRFPLTVGTEEYPPLVKFAGRFGVLELNANPVLPVTVRNLEPEISGQLLKVGEPGPRAQAGPIAGRTLRLDSAQLGTILEWLQRIHSHGWNDRNRSVFTDAEAEGTPILIPKPGGPQAFEVIGIPLPQPGFYVVELESPKLGAALLEDGQTMYVPAAALVTNLAVHFKWGIDASLVWVTNLDSGRPAAHVQVEILDCRGGTLWSGTTDSQGVAQPAGLPSPGDEFPCPYGPLRRGLFVAARLGDDLAFAHSDWQEGIESWRFNLPVHYQPSLVRLHTVFSRNLLRAGDTVHMKHFIRQRDTTGFSPASRRELPQNVTIRHTGSEQEIEFPVAWDQAGVAETEWPIPRDARLGVYQVYFPRPGGAGFWDGWHAGEFRVQEFRVPLMRGSIDFPETPLIAPSQVPVDLNVQYLNGGGAGSLPVRLRYTTAPAYVSFDTFEGFSIGRGTVQEGVRRQGETAETTDEQTSLRRLDLTLDQSGSARASLTGLPPMTLPTRLTVELDYPDPVGESQTVSNSAVLWPADTLVGIRAESWLADKNLDFQVAAMDVNGRPLASVHLRVDLLQRRNYSHRKRLIGGYYAYEHFSETNRLETICQGETDEQGQLSCRKEVGHSGNLIIQVTAEDSQGRETSSHADVWIAGRDRWWFAVDDHDRMDLIPDRKEYEPGETARFQVRMPFERATALVTVEREGVGTVFVTELAGQNPVVEVPLQGQHAPNVFVSVLVVRGRIGGVQPTAMVDLGRPAHKLGIAQISVGWKAHELKVDVSTDRETYRVRETVRASIAVQTADGRSLPAGTEVAVAAVDEGLLDLLPNNSWELLQAMMGRRGYGVRTSTAQMHVVGKRHFGQKALPAGGGGGRQLTRELFDTLLIWKARLPLDSEGRAEVEIPLNDSLTRFRIVAIASGAMDRFGTGAAWIRTTQDLMILSGVAPVVREGDRIRSEFTIRNASRQQLDPTVSIRVSGISAQPAQQRLSLAPGDSKVIGWDLQAPVGVTSLRYELTAEAGGIADRLAIDQRVVPAVPVQVFQATIASLEETAEVPVERPRGALPAKGGIQVHLQPSLVGGLSSVADQMRRYPYTCLEQRISSAVTLQDRGLWERLMVELPNLLDSDGLARYFPTEPQGSDVLTSYLFSVAHEAGWEIPPGPREAMGQGLLGFVEGRLSRPTPWRAPDLTLRKVAALEALSRYDQVRPDHLTLLPIEPNLWPTSTVIDWFNVLHRIETVPERERRIREAGQVLRSRLVLQGTVLNLASADSDRLWWLMTSPDAEMARLVLAAVNTGTWTEDVPRLIRGLLSRQRRGSWDLTTANAWGTLAVRKFAAAFEREPVTGRTAAALQETRTLDWQAQPQGAALPFDWPENGGSILLNHDGTGRPWITVESRAAVPLEAPVWSGYRIRKSLAPLEQRTPGQWSVGDLIRIRLEVEAGSDMGWVVVEDPIPAGSAILGTGLGRSSQLAVSDERAEGWVWPVFQEKSFESFRSYYHYVPRGSFTVEYTIRLNSSGHFNLPPSRVEALYFPEMFGTAPNDSMGVVR